MQRVRVFAVVLTLLLGAGLTATFARSASAEAAWQFTINRLDPSPQDSGGQIRYRIQLGCSAVDETVCRFSEIRFPAQDPTTFSFNGHPIVQAFSFDTNTNEWVFNLQDYIAAGTTAEFDLIATAPNNTTPDGTPFVINATLSSENVPDKTATASGEWNAQANLGIAKYLQFGPNTDALLDQEVDYLSYPCDPTWSSGQLGHLFVENATIVDTLPDGVVFVDASNGGVYDANNNTVTWTIPGQLSNFSCGYKGFSDYSVTVTFPSDTFGPAGQPTPVLEATNSVTIDAYPLGTPNTPENLLEDEDSILHGCGLPNPTNLHVKYARTPYVGSD